MYDIQANLKTWRHLTIASSKIFRVTVIINPGGHASNPAVVTTTRHYMVSAESPDRAIKIFEHLFDDCPHHYELSAKLEKFYIPKVWAADGVSKHHVYWGRPAEMNRSILWGRRNPSWEEMINL